MKPAVFFLSMGALCAAPFAWCQASPAPNAAQPPAASSAIKPRGPDAVAAQDPNRVVATINGEKVTAKQANDMLKAFPPEQRAQLEQNLAKNLEQIVTQDKLAEAASKLNLDKQEPWKGQLELTRKGVLSRAYIDHLSKSATGPAEDPQKYFNDHQAEFELVKLSGIFVGYTPPGTPANSAPATAKTEEAARAKADDLEKKIKAGGDFAALARTESEHQTAAKGGDLGNIPINDPQAQIPPDIRTAVEKLQPGQVTEPIRIPNAFLIVKLESRDKLDFEKARPGIVQRLQDEKRQAAVRTEIDKYKIQVQDQDFFETKAPAANIPSLQRPGSTTATPAKP